MASKLKDTQDYSENLHILVPEHFQSVSVRYSATSQLAGIPNNWISWFHPWKENKGKISTINFYINFYLQVWNFANFVKNLSKQN